MGRERERERERDASALFCSVLFCRKMLKYGTFCREMLKYSTFCRETLKYGILCRKSRTYALRENNSELSHVARKPNNLCYPVLLKGITFVISPNVLVELLLPM